jgi:hypothetical protein
LIQNHAIQNDLLRRSHAEPFEYAIAQHCCFGSRSIAAFLSSNSLATLARLAEKKSCVPSYENRLRPQIAASPYNAPNRYRNTLQVTCFHSGVNARKSFQQVLRLARGVQRFISIFLCLGVRC